MAWVRGLVFAVLALLAPSAQADAPDPRAQQLITAWLDAQNRGDFAAYQALYANEFHGVRRSADRVRKFDRAGWLADRARMFKKTMVVRVDDVVTYASAFGVTAQFVQHWSSGSYADVGAKELVLGKRGDQLLIVREELLESIVGARAVAANLALSPRQVAAVRALYPDFDRGTNSAGARRVDNVLIAAGCGGQSAALVLFRGEREGELALVSGDAPAVLARTSLTAPEGAKLVFSDTNPVGLALGGGECALRVEVHPNADEDGTVTLRLYRVTAPTLTLVLERDLALTEITRLSAADSVNVECSGAGHTPCDLEGETTAFYCCDCEGNGTIERSTFRWNGKRYQLAKHWER